MRERPQKDENMENSLRDSLKEQLEDRLSKRHKPKKTPRHIREPGEPGSKTSFLQETLSGVFGTISTRDITTFCEELALLLEAGLPLVPALRTLAERSTNPKLGRMVNDMSNQIEAGATFSEAAESYSQHFGQLFINIFRAGERSGTLVKAIERVAERGERIMETRHRLISVLIYPVIIIIFAIVVICFAFTYTMSTFEPLLRDMGAGIPWTMETLLNVGNRLQSGSFWGGLLLFGLGLAAIYAVGVHFSGFRLVRDRFLIRCPWVKRFVKQGVVANFARVFGTMLRAGVPLPEALQAARNTSKNEVVRLAVDRTQETVKEGGRLVPPLEKEKLFPALAYDMMEVGEETGELDHVFQRIADIYEEKAANDLEILGKLVHPAVIVVLAIIVGFIVLAMFHTYAHLLVHITGGGMGM